MLAAHRWTTNAELIADCARLGYLSIAAIVDAVNEAIGELRTVETAAADKGRTIRHGTRGAYVNDDCRCPDCSGANRRYQERWRADNFGGGAPEGHLPVLCWCTASAVAVPVADIRAKRTRSCGRPDCREPQP